jgi:hypothetical protein
VWSLQGVIPELLQADGATGDDAEGGVFIGEPLRQRPEQPVSARLHTDMARKIHLKFCLFDDPVPEISFENDFTGGLLAIPCHSAKEVLPSKCWLVLKSISVPVLMGPAMVLGRHPGCISHKASMSRLVLV